MEDTTRVVLQHLLPRLVSQPVLDIPQDGLVINWLKRLFDVYIPIETIATISSVWPITPPN